MPEVPAAPAACGSAELGRGCSRPPDTGPHLRKVATGKSDTGDLLAASVPGQGETEISMCISPSSPTLEVSGGAGDSGCHSLHRAGSFSPGRPAVTQTAGPAFL